jgi:hypothetical protein
MPLQPAGRFSARAGVPPSPSMLVGAHLGAAPFLDYGGILADLVGWMDNHERGGLRILSGPAGTGKTRTALRLCQEAEKRRWLSGLLVPDADADALKDLMGAPTPLLVVIEHAETQSAQLATLLPLLAERAQSGYRARVILTIRDAAANTRWLEPHAWLEEASVRDLAECPPDMAARRQLFLGASQAFAAHRSLPPTSNEDVGDPLFATPLLVLMSAYLRVRHDPIPDSAPELLDRFIDDHEDRYWCWLATQGDTPVLQDKALRVQMAAFATLAGAGDGTEADRLLRLMNDRPSADEQQRRQVCEWASGLYPGPRYWNPLPTDLIAEHLVARAASDDAGLLGAALSDARAGSPGQTVRLLARAAIGRPPLAATVTTMVNRRLGYLCQRAASDSPLASALTGLVQVCPPDPGGLRSILDEIAAPAAPGVRSLAAVLNHQAARHYRALAEQDPDCRPHLAVALNNLSVHLADIGRQQDASEAAGEAVALYRDLPQAGSDESRASLARALYNLSLRLAAIGQRDPATSAAGEAVGLFRALAEAHPPSYRPQLAAALRLLARCLADDGRREKARAAIIEAVTQYRALADADPAYRPVLAASLEDLAQRLTDIDQAKEAARFRAEARVLSDAPRREQSATRRR